MWSEAIIRRQGQVDKQYAGLKELAEDRKKQLDHTYHHFLLSREVEDLDHWIAERDVVASSQEMGQDLDHVTVNNNISHVKACACFDMCNARLYIFSNIYILDQYNYNHYVSNYINILDPAR